MPPTTRAVIAVLAVAALLLPLLGTHERELLHVGVQGACVVVAGTSVLRRRGALGLGWSLAVLAMTVLWLGDTVRAADRHGWHLALHPTPADLLTAAGYLALGLAALRVHRDSSRSRPLPGGTEAAIFAAGLLTPLLVFVVEPVLRQPDLGVGTRAVTIAYAAADLVVVTMVVRLTVSRRRPSPSLLCLSAAAFASLTADIWSATQHAGAASVVPGVQALWVAAFVLFAAGVAHPSLTGLGSEQLATDAAPEHRRLGLMAVGVVLPALALLVLGVRQVSVPLLVVAIGSLLVSLLVSARVYELMQQISDQSARLSDLARSDELTGLHNRRSWNFELTRACAAASSAAQPLSVALLDLDHFKSYNDTYGHPAGDRLLKAAADAWRSGLRPGEVLARYGGEEFAVLLPGTGLDEAVRRLEELRALTPGGQSFSAGVALWTGTGEPEQTVADADIALYDAKRQGRSRVLPFRPPGPKDEPGLSNALRTVVQPIVRLADLAVVAYEALSRFDPATDVEAVFRAAHEDGYGDLLEGSAILSALRLPERPAGVDLFVNVSERAMRSTHFWQAMPPRLDGVVVELLEHRSGLDDASVNRLLDRFRDRGARICLDDLLGSQDDLDRIVSLRPDLVKLDRSLVAGCPARPEQRDLLARLLDFARGYGVAVCAEGVETPEELSALCDLGVPLVQGFLLGRPEGRWVEPLQPALRLGALTGASAPVSPT
jgi:diguanylate cyclase (GGDEF)-like protein